METLELYRQFCPYPSVDSEYKFHEGLLFSHPRVCQKCKKKKCWEPLPNKLVDDISHFECHIGLSLIPVRLETGIILINGVIESPLNKTCPSHIRKENRSHKVLMENVRRWHSLISDNAPSLLPRLIAFATLFSKSSIFSSDIPSERRIATNPPQ